MFNDSHAMGLLGPQVIASTKVQVNQEVDGYVELLPVKWLALNGPPVIRMKIRWSLIGEERLLPTPGATSVLVDAWQAMTGGAQRPPPGDHLARLGPGLCLGARVQLLLLSRPRTSRPRTSLPRWKINR